ncbi:MAG: amino acid ABC transporter substrate-binding protein [Dehalococcoidia bacterium]
MRHARRRTGPVLWLLAITIAVLGACSGDSDAEVQAQQAEAVSDTLDRVSARGVLRVGVNDALPGFGYLQPDGSFAGFDVDFGRAVAAAVLGDADLVELIPVSATNRFDSLRSGEIDVLIRNTSWSLSRDASLQFAFSVPTFYDGQGVMVRTADRITTLEELDGAVVCSLASTTTQLNAEDRFTGTDVGYQALAFDRAETLQEAFIAQRCDAWTADRSQLAARRAAFPAQAGGPTAVRILPPTLSREPLAIVTRQEDIAWSELMNWIVLGMLLADELDVTSENLDERLAAPPGPEAARLLGTGEGETFNTGLGLPPGFMQAVIRQVGNYDEVYRRNLDPLGIPRAGTPNAAYRDGGLMYAPPWR